MRILLFFMLTFFTSIVNLQSQNQDYNFEFRKNNLFFSVGSEYRLTPIRGSIESTVVTNYILSIDAQNSGAAFSYALDYHFTKNFAFGFSHSIRYDVILNDANNISSDTGAESAQRGLIFGYHFYLDYHLKIFKNSELFFRVGKSLLNRGTDFTTKRTFGNNDSNEVILYSTSDFAYEPWNFALGYKKQRFSFIGGVYTSSNTDYFQETVSFIIPYFSFRYNLGKLWKNN